MSVIGIVGAGEQGAALAARLVGANHVVRIANSRGRDTLGDVAMRTGAKAVDIADVAAGVDLLFLVVPLGQIPTVRSSLMASLAGDAVVVDVGSYVPPRDGRIAAIDAGLPETAWVAQQLGVPVVKALNNITYDSLARGAAAKGTPGRIALPVAGDDPSHRSAVMCVIDSLGFDACDAGPLDDSWRQQIGQPAYCTDPTLAELPGLLARADRATVATKREEAMRMMARMPPDIPKPDLVKAARFMAGLDRGRPATWAAMLRLGWAMLRYRATT